MSVRPLDGATAAAVADPYTRPIYLVKLGFETPLRLSTAEEQVWNSETWAAGPVRVQFTGRGARLSIFNEGGTLGQTLQADGTAGRTVTIWKRFRTGPSTLTDPAQLFDGYMLEAPIGDRVQIECTRERQFDTPRHVISSAICNHLVPDGTQIRTPAGLYTLER